MTKYSSMKMPREIDFKAKGGGRDFFFTFICYSHHRMLSNAFYGIQKYLLVFDWGTIQSQVSYIFLYNSWDKNWNCEETKKTRFGIVCGQYSSLEWSKFNTWYVLVLSNVCNTKLLIFHFFYHFQPFFNNFIYIFFKKWEKKGQKPVK